MAIRPFRRVVTGANQAGRSVVVSDEEIAPSVVDSEVVMWATEGLPADGAGSDDMAKKHPNLEPPENGSVIRMVEFPPISALSHLSPEEVEAFFKDLFEQLGASHCRVDTERGPGMHKTNSIDYVIVLSGEVTMVLDEGEVTLKPFDVVVQCGANHGWINRGSTPAMIAAVLMHSSHE